MEPLQLEMFLRLAESLHDREMVLDYLQLLVQLGYRLSILEEEISRSDGKAGITPGAQQARETYLAQRQSNLELRIDYRGKLRIKGWLTLEPEKGQISFLVDHEHFTGSDEGMAAFLALVKMFKETYRYWHPLYGYQKEPDGVQPERENVLKSCEISSVYSINFLGPEIVERLGREQVLDAPAWRKDPLDDGGVLLIPDNTYDLHIPFAIKRLAVALGLQTPQIPGEEWFEDIYDDPAAW